MHFAFLSSTWNYLTKKPPPVEGDHLQDVIVAPEHSTSPNTEALIQRAEALDDDKLKEKEALTTQALE